ncbi:MAG: M15 family metallopeptidase [Nanoarchaeota archaeon]
MDIEEALQKKGLVNIQSINNHIRLDLRYATANNITKKKLYSRPLCFFREEVAENLSFVQQELENKGLTLIIWDGYRPLRIQTSIWNAFPHPTYNTKISSHNKGIAVDLTLGDKDGNPLPMPTAFDVFGEQSHHGFGKLPETVIANRETLKDVMERHGFERFEFEWWHYTYTKLKDVEVLDIPI